jgi:hypothetical protein
MKEQMTSKFQNREILNQKVGRERTFLFNHLVGCLYSLDLEFQAPCVSHMCKK